MSIKSSVLLEHRKYLANPQQDVAPSIIYGPSAIGVNLAQARHALLYGLLLLLIRHTSPLRSTNRAETVITPMARSSRLVPVGHLEI